MKEKINVSVGDRVRLTGSGGYLTLAGGKWETERGTVTEVIRTGEHDPCPMVLLRMDDGTNMPSRFSARGWAFYYDEYELIEEPAEGQKFLPGDIVSLKNCSYLFYDNEPRVGCVVRKHPDKDVYVVFAHVAGLWRGVVADGWSVRGREMELIYRHDS